MNILVTGAEGQLGKELRKTLEISHPGLTTYTDVDDLDITDAKAVEDFIASHEFTHIINCAGYTAVAELELTVPVRFLGVAFPSAQMTLHTEAKYIPLF